jgi:dTDP-4-amino-4,6-dideoxygalactose transaminase
VGAHLVEPYGGAVIPVSDPTRQNLALLPEMSAAVDSVMRHGKFVAGPEVAQFEKAFARWIGVAHAVGVGNGTDAIRLMLEARGIGPGDEVVVPDFTMVATVEPVLSLGAKPVLVEVDPRGFGIAPESVAEAVTSRTRAVIVVHLFGTPSPLPDIDDGIDIFEDACQSHGAVLGGRCVGTIGIAGAFSFFPAKNLGGIGDGGMVTTNDASVADRVRRLRNHGRTAQFEHAYPGWNSRLDTIQAAALLVKLAHIEERNRRRRAIASTYHEHFADLDLDLPVVPTNAESVYNLFVVGSNDRDGLQRRLAEQGVNSLVHYDRPLHRQPALQDRVVRPRRPERTERLCRRVLSLPCFPELTDSEVEQVIQATVRAVQKR